MKRFTFHEWFFHIYLFLFLFNISTLSWGAESISLEKSTLNLVNISKMRSIGKEISIAQLNQTIATAEKRRDALVVEMEKNPQAAVKFLLTNKIVSFLPRQVRPYVESEIKGVEGTLELRAALFQDTNADKKSDKKTYTNVIQYLLHKDNGDTYYIDFLEQAPSNLKTGDRIKISHAINIPTTDHFNHLVISAKEFIKVKAARMALPGAIGPQNTIVILVNFQDQPTVQPWTPAAVNDLVFNSVNNDYFESSYHQTTVIGQVVGWYTIAMNSTATCAAVQNTLPSLAQQAATLAGVDLSAYVHQVYMFPSNLNCAWAGLGTVGNWGAFSEAWINGYNQVSITGHELGHNLGLFHSHLLICPGSSNQGTCTTSEYGDAADIMGSGGTAHFNSFQKERLGWLNYKASPPITSILSTGNFTIAPYETFDSNVKALKILKQILPDGSSDYYYLEFRQPIGFDSNLNCTNCDFTKGILIHQANSLNPNSSDLLDMTPNDSNTSTVALLPGQTFSDLSTANGRLDIMVNSVSATGANVSVNIGGIPPTCVHSQPTMTITPATTQYVATGGAFGYNVTLKNNDSASCIATQFNFTAAPPKGVTTLFETTSLTLSPGATDAVIMQIASTTLTPPGIYSVPVTGMSAANPAFFATGTASFGIIAAGCIQNNPTVALLPTVQIAKPGTTLTYSISVTNADTFGCVTSTFGMSGFIPGGGGWSGSISPGTLVLAPGKNGIAKLTVTSPTTAANASYVVTGIAINTLNRNFFGRSSAFYIVQR